MPEGIEERLAARGAHEPGIGVVAVWIRPAMLALAPQVVQCLLLNVRKDVEKPAAGLVLREALVGIAGPPESPAAGRQEALLLLVVEAAQCELFELVSAGRNAAPLRGPTGPPAARARSRCR